MAQAAVYIVCYVLVDLGYFMGLAKSVLQPSTRITYLGLVFDTARQAFILPQDKVVKFVKLREAIVVSKNFVQVKTLQRFQGKCISFSLAVPGVKLFIRSTAAAIASAGSNPQVPMSPALREELTHWRFLDSWEDCIRWRDEKHLILSMSSDSSGFVWGGVFHLPEGNLEVRDYGSSEEAALHISKNEMLALLRVLQSSPVELRDCRVDVNVDSQVLLDTWSRGGSRSPQLTAATKEVFHLVSGRNIQLTLYKVPSKGNIADLPSRHLSPSDSKLSLQSWKRIQEAFGGEIGHTLDFMALDSNVQPDFEGSSLPHFTPFPTPQSAGVNLFAQNPITWKRKENRYVFPLSSSHLPIG